MLIKLSQLHKKFNLKINGISHFGAHLGQEVDSYKNLGIKNIHLFEPQKAIYESLKDKFKDDNDIKIYNFGLGSKNENVNLNLAPGNNGLSASVLTPEDHFEYYPNIEFMGNEEIKLCIYDELEIEDINFLNIDIQGYEMEALQGCRKVLKNDIEYIFIEISRKPLYKGSALVGDIDNYLNNYGFIRVSTRWASSKVPWADSFYIKENNLSSNEIIKAKIIKFFENFGFFYIFIDPYRYMKKKKYRIKQKLKKILT
tara:strand:- start:448 stop:1215 length:768 start_codon:yes stop_codon:yes gene_type:complete